MGVGDGGRDRKYKNINNIYNYFRFCILVFFPLIYMPTNKYIQLSLTYRYQLIRCINVILSCNCVILSTNKGLRGSKKTSVLFSHGLNKACLIPDSYRATERNGNSISVDFTEYSIENDEHDDCFCPFLTIWQVFFTFILHCSINTIYVHCR